MTAQFLCGATREYRFHNFLAVSPHRVSAYGVFFLWDAQFGYGFRKAGHSKTMPDNTSVAVETTTKNDSTGASYNDHDENVVFDC